MNNEVPTELTARVPVINGIPLRAALGLVVAAAAVLVSTFCTVQVGATKFPPELKEVSGVWKTLTFCEIEVPTSTRLLLSVVADSAPETFTPVELVRSTPCHVANELELAMNTIA